MLLCKIALVLVVSVNTAIINEVVQWVKRNGCRRIFIRSRTAMLADKPEAVFNRDPRHPLVLRRGRIRRGNPGNVVPIASDKFRVDQRPCLRNRLRADRRTFY
jgi:hypothetical protein